MTSLAFSHYFEENAFRDFGALAPSKEQAYTPRGHEDHRIRKLFVQVLFYSSCAVAAGAAIAFTASPLIAAVPIAIIARKVLQVALHSLSHRLKGFHVNKERLESLAKNRVERIQQLEDLYNIEFRRVSISSKGVPFDAYMIINKDLKGERDKWTLQPLALASSFERQLKVSKSYCYNGDNFNHAFQAMAPFLDKGHMLIINPSGAGTNGTKVYDMRRNIEQVDAALCFLEEQGAEQIHLTGLCAAAAYNIAVMAKHHLKEGVQYSLGSLNTFSSFSGCTADYYSRFLKGRRGHRLFNLTLSAFFKALFTTLGLELNSSRNVRSLAERLHGGSPISHQILNTTNDEVVSIESSSLAHAVSDLGDEVGIHLLPEFRYNSFRERDPRSHDVPVSGASRAAAAEALFA